MAKVVGINHVAFVVKDLEGSIQTAVGVLGAELVIKFESIKQKYIGAVIQLGDSYISYLQATDDASFVAQHLEKRGPGVQHMGLTIDNLEEYVEDLESKGVRVEKSDMKSENFKEALVGPKTGGGVVLQLMQWKEGVMDVSPEGKQLMRRKYMETPGMRVIE